MKRLRIVIALFTMIMSLTNLAIASDDGVITSPISIKDSYGSEVKTEFAIVLPNEYDEGKDYPLLVALHGYGGNAESFTKAWRGLTQNNGYILLCPQGADGLGKENSYGWDSRADAVVIGTIKEAQKKYKIDENRIYITGFSQGAYQSYKIALDHPELFSGAAPVAGNYNSSSMKPLLESAMGVGFYIIHGEKDRNVDQAREAKADMIDAGIRVVYKEYKGLGHSFPGNRGTELQKVITFFNTL